MIAGLCAQQVSLFDASRAGVFLHGLCAELAMEKNNEYSLIASDLIDYIPQSIQYIMEREFVEEKNND
jgi:NAD(P)H-hydrate epimerase